MFRDVVHGHPPDVLVGRIRVLFKISDQMKVEAMRSTILEEVKTQMGVNDDELE